MSNVENRPDKESSSDSNFKYLIDKAVELIEKVLYGIFRWIIKPKTWNYLILYAITRLIAEFSSIKDGIYEIIDNWIKSTPDMDSLLLFFLDAIKILIVWFVDSGSEGSTLKWFLFIIVIVLISVVPFIQFINREGKQKIRVQNLRRGIDEENFNTIFKELENIADEQNQKEFKSRIVFSMGSFYSKIDDYKELFISSDFQKMKKKLGKNETTSINKIEKVFEFIEKKLR